jgi:acetolactate synthase-1/2/3 large subunit
MGFGVPAAMAASLQFPERPVVGVIGDGGFGMMASELETARRLGIYPLFVVFCDRALAIVKIAQRVRKNPHVGVDFAPVNWAGVAEGFGAKAVAPQNLSELRSAIEQWLHARELTVLAVPIDPDLYEGLSY